MDGVSIPSSLATGRLSERPLARELAREYVRAWRAFSDRRRTWEGSEMTFTTTVISTDLAFALVRAVGGLVISAHGAQKVLGVWGGPGLAGWTQGIARMGLRPVPFWASVSSLAGFAGGPACALGFLWPLRRAALTTQTAG